MKKLIALLLLMLAVGCSSATKATTTCNVEFGGMKLDYQIFADSKDAIEKVSMTVEMTYTDEMIEELGGIEEAKKLATDTSQMKEQKGVKYEVNFDEKTKIAKTTVTIDIKTAEKGAVDELLSGAKTSAELVKVLEKSGAKCTKK